MLLATGIWVFHTVRHGPSGLKIESVARSSLDQTVNKFSGWTVEPGPLCDPQKSCHTKFISRHFI